MPWKFWEKPKKLLTPFKLVERDEHGAVWAGDVPQVPYARIYLLLWHLNPTASGLPVRPEKRFKTATHEVRIGAALSFGKNIYRHIYISQHDFSIPNRDANLIALIIMRSICQEIKRADPKKLLLPNQETFNYWEDTIDGEVRFYKRQIKEQGG